MSSFFETRRRSLYADHLATQRPEEEPVLDNPQPAPANSDPEQQEPLLVDREVTPALEIEVAPAAEAEIEPRDTGMDVEPDKGTDADNQMIVGRNITVRGDVSGCDSIRIAGTVEASFDGESLEVMAGGVYRGDANAKSAEIHGFVEGNITVTDLLRVHPGATLRGRVRYGSVEVMRGATIGGEFAALEAAQPDSSEGPKGVPDWRDIQSTK